MGPEDGSEGGKWLLGEGITILSGRFGSRFASKDRRSQSVMEWHGVCYTKEFVRLA